MNAEKLEKELSEIEDYKQKELERARNTSMNIIENTKIQSNELLDELQSIRKQKEKEKFSDMVTEAERTSKRILNKMYDKANPVTPKKKDNYKLPRSLKTGDYVFITSINQNGTVVGNVDSKGFVFVQSGIMKMKINISELRLAEKEKTQKKNNKMMVRQKKDTAVRQVQQELDIRGYASDEGVAEVEMFLNNAVMTGLSLVTVIHGKGTGVLRKAVHARLKTLSIVKSYRLGVYGEGEDGVTIIELK